jgi:outer membrane protein TolC
MKRITGVLLLLSIVGISQGQLHFSSLGDLIQYADKNSLVTHQSGIQQSISRQDLALNKSALLPKVNLFGTAEYDPIIPSLVVPSSALGGSSNKFQRVQFGLPLLFSSGVELTMPIINLEKWEQLKRYKLQSRQTTLETSINMETLHIQLTQYYYQAVIAEELIQINKDNQAITDELLQILEERKKNGLLDPADFNRAKYLQIDMLSSGVEYEKNYFQTLIYLRQLVAIPDSISIIIKDSISDSNWLIIPEKTAITNRPAWQAASGAITIAEQQLKESQKAGLPSVSLDGKYTYESQIQPSIGQHINYDFSSIGLRLDFPLFQGDFYKTNKHRSQLQLELAQLSQQQTTTELIRQQSEWWNGYSAAVKKQVLLRQKLDLATENIRIARLNVKEGLMEFDEFNTLFQEYARIKMDNLQNLSDGIIYKLLLTQKW